MTSGRRALLGAALAAAVVASYAGSLDAGFLNYDDDWLIERNWILGGAADPALDSPERSESRSALSILGTIWGDRSRETRLTLGAEYLPIRDTVVWLQLTAFGPNAPAMRVVSLLLYLAAALAMRRWLHGFVGRVLGPNRNGEFVAETSAWLFALHPVHVESVAWLAGQKDVLCLWFTALALLAYSDSRPRARWLAVVAGVAASLSKGPAVVLPLLLVATDLAQSRKIDWTVIGFSACAAAGIAGVQTSVGSTVGLFAPVHGGSRLATLATMGPVMWQYLGLSFGIVQPNIVEEVAIRSAADPWAWMAWAPLAGGVAATVWAARRGQRLPPFALGWFAIALAPVSQVVFPLQHLIADRYLFVAVLGPCLVVAWGLGEWRARGRARWPLAVAVALCAAATLGTAYRTVLFGDSLLLWMDATRRTERSPAGPYQLDRKSVV